MPRREIITRHEAHLAFTRYDRVSQNEPSLLTNWQMPDRYQAFFYNSTEYTIRQKGFKPQIVDAWSTSLSRKLMPRTDLHGNFQIFSSLAELEAYLKEVLDPKLR